VQRFVMVLGFGVLAVSSGATAQTSAGASAAAVDSGGPVTRLAAAPAIVGEGVISTPAEEFKATVSPDGQTLMYVVTDHRFRHMTIAQSHLRGTAWSTPTVADFSGVWRDGDPAFAPDGRTLVFISNRPFPGDTGHVQRHNYNMWRITRHSDGTWGTPAPFASTVNTDTSSFAPSLTATGTLYFSRGDVIYRSALVNGEYAAPEPLPFHGGDPSISADERFIIFDAATPAGNTNLFVSCRTPAGWTTPSRFLEPVSSKFDEGDPWISADGHWLYFYSTRFAPAPDRAPRPRRATYDEIEREALGNIYNGSRHLYQVDLSSLSCDHER
jgi:Tol biopolymer transport system component